MAPTTRRPRRYSELPTDVLFDVLLLLSAKELCRLRLVCRAWRSVTSDPHFIRAHAARHHRDPLFVASFLCGPSQERKRMRIDLIDLSGKTVKRVASAMDRGQVLCPRLGLVCVADKSNNTCRVLDPAAVAGAPVAPRYTLPVLPAPSHRGRGSRRRLAKAATSFALGRVAATGEHKVLRIFHGLKDDDDRPQHLFEVLTLGGGRRGRARWRDMQIPDMFVCPDSSAVVDGVVYFLRNAVYKSNDMATLPTTHQPSPSAGTVVPPADVTSFDLEREEWRKPLQGPTSMGCDDEVDLDHRWCQFRLAELKGSPVLANYFYFMTRLWVLTNFETGVWVKQYSIGVKSIEPSHLRRLKPLFVLDDGRLVVRPRGGGDLAIYDPRTDVWARVESGPLHLGAVGIYAGSLLGLRGTC